MKRQQEPHITDLIGRIPYRLALAGGWIDQPFVSKHNPSPPGSMVVVNIEPEFRFMDRAGICSSTRSIALKLWNGDIPQNKSRDELVRELYETENKGKAEPSGSQDMIGLIYPGINRLDYDFNYEGGVFPCHIESNNNPEIAQWLSRVIHILTVMPRPEGYNPLGVKNLDPKWVCRLGQAGKDCFDAITRMDIKGLGESLNENMRCWNVLLPHNFRHPVLTVDLLSLLHFYQVRYAGAMCSGCGGGYLYVISEEPVPGAFHATVRVAK
ncbi:MAG: hypothetical protein ABSB25_02000 [Sedimentisphaerales bacterium]|jgi:hypothetical protein